MLLRIFFTGLVAFVPSADESEITVLLSDTRGLHAHPDVGEMERHEPIVLIRADDCSGACRPSAEHGVVARFLFPEQDGPADRARRALDNVIEDGGFWRLDGSDLDIRTGNPTAGPEQLRIVRSLSPGLGGALQLPRSAEELASFDWVPTMGSILEGSGTIDPDVLSTHPRKGLIAARLTLDAGQIRTYTVAQLDENVLPVRFALDAGRESKHPVRAMANWVVAEIPIDGCRVTLTDRSFEDGKHRRSMTLSLGEAACKRGSTLDMVVMNLPASSFERLDGPREPPTVEAIVGRHFDYYYELSASRPPREQRPLPTPVLDIDKDLLLPVEKKIGGEAKVADGSPLLDDLLAPPKGVHSWPICPPVQFAAPAAVSTPLSLRESP